MHTLAYTFLIQSACVIIILIVDLLDFCSTYKYYLVYLCWNIVRIKRMNLGFKAHYSNIYDTSFVLQLMLIAWKSSIYAHIMISMVVNFTYVCQEGFGININWLICKRRGTLVNKHWQTTYLASEIGGDPVPLTISKYMDSVVYVCSISTVVKDDKERQT
jgi:hypothetical protein